MHIPSSIDIVSTVIKEVYRGGKKKFNPYLKIELNRLVVFEGGCEIWMHELDDYYRPIILIPKGKKCKKFKEIVLTNLIYILSNDAEGGLQPYTFVRQRCNNRLCVKPDHLELVYPRNLF